MKKKQLEMEKQRCHSASPMHLAACIRGGAIYRNRKKYSRKSKYKEKYGW